jgi:butyrate kinase
MTKNRVSMGEEAVIVVNPGSTSTRVAIRTRDRELVGAVVDHIGSDLVREARSASQLGGRLGVIEEWLEGAVDAGWEITCVVGRGGLLRPIEGGTYVVDEAMLDDLKCARYGDHASNLGAPIARRLADRYGVEAYVVDPVTVDEFWERSRISGVPGITRRCRSHTLNIKASARKVAASLGKGIDEIDLVVAHLGGGVSIVALRRGRIVDVNDALLGQGPFSPNRAGSLPIGPLVELAFSGRYGKKELLDLLSRGSGLYAYLGTADVREVERMIEEGDERAALVFDAMLYQISKEIGAMAAALGARPAAIVLTGGMAQSDRVVAELHGRIEFLAPVHVIPGEHEMEALAEGAFRVVDGIEEAKRYGVS